MDREAILARLEVLRKQREQAFSTLSAIAGAIQENEAWLKLVDSKTDQENRPTTE